MQSLAQQLQAQGVDTATTASILKAADLYTMYAHESPLCRPLHPTGEYRLPFTFNDDMHQGYKKQGHFLMLDARINGTNEPVVFDTGAGMNIISSRQAEACGLRQTEITIDMQGIGRQQGRIAIADTLRIGPMAWQNVPFLIVDTRTGDAEADSVGGLLQPVIGLPIMLSMKEVQFDFEHRELVIPATPTPNPLNSSNLLRTDSEGLRVESRDDEGHPMYMHLDTGSYGSDLTARWYAAHRTQVEAQGQPDSLRMAGIGGVSRQKTYRIPHLTYRIGQGEATIEDVHVSTGLDLHTGQPVGEMFGIGDIDGIIGLGLLEHFRRSPVVITLGTGYHHHRTHHGYCDYADQHSRHFGHPAPQQQVINKDYKQPDDTKRPAHESRQSLDIDQLLPLGRHRIIPGYQFGILAHKQTQKDKNSCEEPDKQTVHHSIFT